MENAESWSTNPKHKKAFFQKILVPLSKRVREKQFRLLWKIFEPKKSWRVLDVGVSPDETLTDSNFFEKRYPFKDQLVAVSVEDCQEHFQKDYPKIKFIKISPGKPLPFRKDDFDIVVSWATLEHVGTREKQGFLLREILRVGKRAFVTTPDRTAIYEPHSGLFFLHWLPRGYFDFICRLLGKEFWTDVNNLNPLNKRELVRILPKGNYYYHVCEFKMFSFLPSHLILIKNDKEVTRDV